MLTGMRRDLLLYLPVPGCPVHACRVFSDYSRQRHCIITVTLLWGQLCIWELAGNSAEEVFTWKHTQNWHTLWKPVFAWHPHKSHNGASQVSTQASRQQTHMSSHDLSQEHMCVRTAGVCFTLHISISADSDWLKQTMIKLSEATPLSFIFSPVERGGDCEETQMERGGLTGWRGKRKRRKFDNWKAKKKTWEKDKEVL